MPPTDVILVQDSQNGRATDEPKGRVFLMVTLDSTFQKRIVVAFQKNTTRLRASSSACGIAPGDHLLVLGTSGRSKAAARTVVARQQHHVPRNSQALSTTAIEAIEAS